MRRVAVYLEDATWEHLSARAEAVGDSKSRMAAKLIKAGLVSGDPPVVVRASEEFMEGIGWASRNEGALAERGALGESRDTAIPPAPGQAGGGDGSRSVVPRSASASEVGPAEVVGMPDVSGDAEGPVPERSGRVGGASTSETDEEESVVYEPFEEDA